MVHVLKDSEIEDVISRIMSEFRKKLEKLRNKYLESPSDPNEPIYCQECFTIIESCGCESSTPAVLP